MKLCDRLKLVARLLEANQITEQEAYDLIADMRHPYVSVPFVQITDDYSDYASRCGCNPKNGGSGICNCTLGNKITFTTN